LRQDTLGSLTGSSEGRLPFTFHVPRNTLRGAGGAHGYVGGTRALCHGVGRATERLPSEGRQALGSSQKFVWWARWTARSLAPLARSPPPVCARVCSPNCPLFGELVPQQTHLVVNPLLLGHVRPVFPRDRHTLHATGAACARGVQPQAPTTSADRHSWVPGVGLTCPFVQSGGASSSPRRNTLCAHTRVSRGVEMMASALAGGSSTSPTHGRRAGDARWSDLRALCNGSQAALEHLRSAGISSLGDLQVQSVSSGEGRCALTDVAARRRRLTRCAAADPERRGHSLAKHLQRDGGETAS
jgi:hypothetical protein